jgi:hypothetical protein
MTFYWRQGQVFIVRVVFRVGDGGLVVVGGRVKRDLQSKPGSKALRESVTDRPGGQKRPEVNQAVLSAVVNIFRG